MAITVEREIARADINDEGGVSVYQETPVLELSIEQARQHSAAIAAAADEAERIALEDRERMDKAHASSGGYPYIETDKGEVVL